jgi:phage/conjugal plasmid C-4 type zinc finger TraR family protein
MADDADRATEIAERERDTLIRIHQQGRAMALSAHQCEMCGDPIPDLRRHALPGCSECIDCARRLEEGVQS